LKVAALDLGSNTFLCLIAEVLNQQVTKIYSDQVEIVRLGQGLNESKKFHPEALRRADQCLENFSKTIAKHRPEKILAMATSAARDAENREELFKISAKYNIPIEIIPGEKEAAITYQGATSALKLKNKNLMVLDIGGGSTEIIFGQDLKLIIGESYNIGCVRLTEKFIHAQPTPEVQIQQATQFIQKSLQKATALVSKDFQVDEIIAVAGTPTALAVAHIGKFDPDLVDGFQLSQESLAQWLNRLAKANVEQKIDMGIPTGRADVILIGVIILLETLKIFKKNHLTVSTRGVRYGVALEMDRRSKHRSPA
jgi:exopolyphosphatase/guanosine-5'-triphosphate,3'-diphosphate pyrophosphatase